MSSGLSLTSVAALIKAQTHGAATGTGLVPLLKQSNKLYHGNIPAYLSDAVQQLLPATFGGYPDQKDVAPSAVFLVVNLLLTAANIYVFAKNWSRGHRFYPSVAFILYGFLNWIGYALRISWAKDVERVHVGLASNVMILTSTALLAGTNLVLAQRIYTWRHPKIGSSKWFQYNMYFIYAVVLGTIIMGIVSGVVPYLYFLSDAHFNMAKKVARGAGLLTVLYSLTAATLIFLGFVHPPKQKDANFAIYQPWWIQSFSIFYFVPKDAAKVAANTFASRPEHHKKAVRVIASTTQHYTTVEDIKSIDETAPPRLSQNYSILVILLTTILLLISSCFRASSLFITKSVYNQTFVFKPVVMYCAKSMLEAFVLILYLVMRVDLRFYKPDPLRLASSQSNDQVTASSHDEKDIEAVSTHQNGAQQASVV